MPTRPDRIVAYILAILIATVSPLFPAVADDTSLTTQAIIKAMYKVDNWTIKNDNQDKSRDWMSATYHTGVMGLYRATKDTVVLDQALAWAKRHNWMVGTESSGANKIESGQTYLELSFIFKDPSMYAPLETWINSGAANSPSCSCVWWLESGRFHYIDALYVGAPTLAMLAQATHQDKYIGYLNRFFWAEVDKLYHAKDSLFYRDTMALGALDKNGKEIHFSRSNGWLMGAIPRVLSALPKDRDSLTRRSEYIALYKKTASAVAARQSADGFWRANLVDSADVPGVETGGTAFFNYSLAWGINEGILDPAKYYPVVKKAWQAMVRKAIQSDGRLGYLEAPGNHPIATDSNKTFAFGVGAFLLAGEEMAKLVKGPSVLVRQGDEGNKRLKTLMDKKLIFTGDFPIRIPPGTTVVEAFERTGRLLARFRIKEGRDGLLNAGSLHLRQQVSCLRFSK